MEFIKTVMMTLYVRQQKRCRYKESIFGLCGRRRGWDDLREQHWDMCITICEIGHQSKFDAWNRALKVGALGQPRGMGWGGGFGMGDTCTPVADSCQCMAKKIKKKPLQYCKVISLKLKWIKFKNIKVII